MKLPMQNIQLGFTRARVVSTATVETRQKKTAKKDWVVGSEGRRFPFEVSLNAYEAQSDDAIADLPFYLTVWDLVIQC